MFSAVVKGRGQLLFFAYVILTITMLSVTRNTYASMHDKLNWIDDISRNMNATVNIIRTSAPKVQNIAQLLAISVIVAIVVRLGQWHYQRRRLYALGRQVAGPTTYPFIGSAYVLFGNNIDLVSNMIRLKKRYGSTYKLWLGSNLTYMLSNVKDIEILLTSYKAIDKSVYYDFLDPYVGQSVFNAKSERWRKLRRLIEPTFGKKVIESFMSVFSTESLNLLKNIDTKRKENNLNIYELLGNCTFEILCQAAMGVKLDSEKTAPEWFDMLNRGMEIIIKRMLKPWLHIDFIFNNSADGHMVNTRMADFRKYAHKIITEKRIILGTNCKNEFAYVEEDTKRKAFLDLILETKDKNVLLDDKELLDEIILILIAGTDSTTTTICYVLEMIAMHSEVQQQIYNEIMEVLEKNCGDLSYKDVLKLKYLDSVIKESMRILPTILVIGRNITEELKLHSCTLPVGCTASVDILNLQRDPELWPDPLRFNPDRFQASQCSKRSTFAWIPFAAGPRNCIGMQFSMVEMKTILAYLLRRYEVTTMYKSIADMRLMLNFLTKPVEGFKFNLKARE